MEEANISNLPDELIIRILLYTADLTTLANVMRVSRRLYRCANTTVVWKTRLHQLTYWNNDNISNHHKSSCLSADDYKGMCQRYCEIFGSSRPFHRFIAHMLCIKCESRFCDAACIAGRDEMIIFDFGSRTTWFKYASDTTGQLSMHPTVGPISSTGENPLDPGLASNEFCPICTRIILRRLPQGNLTDSSESDPSSLHNGRFARAFSRLSLKNFNCLNVAAAASREADLQLTEEDVDCLIGASGAGTQSVHSTIEAGNQAAAMEAIDSKDRSSCAYLSVYKFLIRHMLKRNPFFQIQNISFVICEPLDCDIEAKLAFTRLLLCELKVPGLCFVPKPVGVALYTGLDTCLVLDSGANNTVISPVLDLCVLTDCVQHINMGGSHLTHALLECLQSKGLIDSEVKEGSIDSSQVKRECYLALDAQAESRKKISPRDIVIKGSRTDRQRLYEVKLSHELYQLSEDMYLHLDLPHKIIESLSYLNLSARKHLLSNIVLTGGNCRLAGLSHRLTHDLKQRLPEELSAVVRVLDPRLMTGRSDAVIGASYVKKWSGTRWITREDYIKGRLNLDDGTLVSRRASEDLVGVITRGSETDDESMLNLSGIGANMSEDELEPSRRFRESIDDAFDIDLEHADMIKKLIDVDLEHNSCSEPNDDAFNSDLENAHCSKELTEKELNPAHHFSESNEDTFSIKLKYSHCARMSNNDAFDDICEDVEAELRDYDAVLEPGGDDVNSELCDILRIV